MRIDPADANALLVVKPSSMGDIIHTLPAVAALHRAHPHLSIQWVANREWTPLLEGNPNLAGVVSFPRQDFRGWKDFPRARKWGRENLRSLRPDIALDFQGLLRSALMARASRARRIIGFRDSREGARFFYHEPVEVKDWDHLHAVDRNFRLVGALGVEVPGAIEFPLPKGTPLTDPGIPESFILLHPFSRGTGKSLSAQETASLCREFGDEVPVVIAGSGFDWPPDVPLPGNAIDLLGKTDLVQLIWLMRRADWIISVDSGPMHLGAAITGRLLSIHTWTDPLKVGPCRKDAWIWRDGFIERIRDIERGQFRDRRENRDRYRGPIFPPGGARRVAQFVKEKLG